METINLNEYLANNEYPGRGIAIAKSPDGKQMFIGYWIMGRSANSRNRIFAEQDGIVSTQPFDASKVRDPSLIIYPAIRKNNNHLIVTNGDQTDTIYDALTVGETFEDALAQRKFEPDGPNWTPRISGLISFADGSFSYKLSILKAANAEATACTRLFFCYEPIPGVGHLIHTYDQDGSPLPSFSGEPKAVEIPENIDLFTKNLWNSLDEDNKISLYVRYTDPISGQEASRMVNKHTGGTL